MRVYKTLKSNVMPSYFSSRLTVHGRESLVSNKQTNKQTQRLASSDTKINRIKEKKRLKRPTT